MTGSILGGVTFVKVLHPCGWADVFGDAVVGIDVTVDVEAIVVMNTDGVADIQPLAIVEIHAVLWVDVVVEVEAIAVMNTDGVVVLQSLVIAKPSLAAGAYASTSSISVPTSVVAGVNFTATITAKDMYTNNIPNPTSVYVVSVTPSVLLSSCTLFGVVTGTFKYNCKWTQAAVGYHIVQYCVCIIFDTAIAYLFQ